MKTNLKKQWRLSILSFDGRVLEQLESTSSELIEIILKNDEGYWSDIKVELKNADGKGWADITNWMKGICNWRND